MITKKIEANENYLRGSRSGENKNMSTGDVLRRGQLTIYGSLTESLIWSKLIRHQPQSRVRF